MLPDRVSNPGPLTYESGALPIALRGPAPFVLRGLCYLRISKDLPSVITQVIIPNQQLETCASCKCITRPDWPTNILAILNNEENHNVSFL